MIGNIVIVLAAYVGAAAVTCAFIISLRPDDLNVLALAFVWPLIPLFFLLRRCSVR